MSDPSILAKKTDSSQPYGFVGVTDNDEDRLVDSRFLHNLVSFAVFLTVYGRLKKVGFVSILVCN
jgi:hypothetical protein